MIFKDASYLVLIYWTTEASPIRASHVLRYKPQAHQFSVVKRWLIHREWEFLGLVFCW